MTLSVVPPLDSSPPRLHGFPTWWHGFIQTDAPPEIHAKMIALRASVGGLKAKIKRDGPSFAVKSAAELVAKVRTAADELGLVMIPVIVSAKSLDVAKGTGADVVMTIRVCAADGSYMDLGGYGQGADSQDKAGGKAVTYAWKVALIYGLLLPDKDMVDTDDDGTPGGVSGLARGKNVVAPSEADGVEKALSAAIAGITDGDSYATVLAGLRAAIDGRDISPQQSIRLSKDMKAKKTALGLQ